MPPDPVSPLRLGFLLFPGFPMACLTSAIEPLRVANEIAGREEFAWTLLAERPGPLRASAGVRFEPDALLAEAEGLDQLLLLSSPVSRFADPAASNARLRRLDRAGVVLGGFSGGIFPLARAGVMEGHRCAVHWCYEAAFRAEFPQIEASTALILRDRRRHTAAGSGAVFDLSLRLIEDRLGRDMMSEVACWFQHPFVREESGAQKVPVQFRGGTDDMLPPTIREAIRIFAEHIEDPLQIADVAELLGMSERNLERGFNQATGQSPFQYYRLMRLRKARQQVLYSTLSILEIARSIGYESSTPMTRHYLRAFGVTPRDERRQLEGLRGLTGGMSPVGEE